MYKLHTSEQRKGLQGQFPHLYTDTERFELLPSPRKRYSGATETRSTRYTRVRKHRAGPKNNRYAGYVLACWISTKTKQHSVQKRETILLSVVTATDMN